MNQNLRRTFLGIGALLAACAAPQGKIDTSGGGVLVVVVMNSAWPDAISPERSKARRTFTDMVKAALDADASH